MLFEFVVPSDPCLIAHRVHRGAFVNCNEIDILCAQKVECELPWNVLDDLINPATMAHEFDSLDLWPGSLGPVP